MNDLSSLQKIKFYLLDLDGTLYMGSSVFPFTVNLLQAFKQRGIKYLFMTNNSSKSAEDHAKKLRNLGINADMYDFITSSQATAYYLNEKYPHAKLYVCGTESLKQELIVSGFNIADNLEEVDCIVIGFDTELTF